MLVFAREKLVFLALPKTGTTALETALEPLAALVIRNVPALKHTPAYRYDRYLKTYLDKCGLKNLKTICVIRHPVDWLGSWYRYRSRPAVDGKSNSTKYMTFDTFVAEYAADSPADWARIGHPARFIRNNEGQMIIDHLFQYEQISLLTAFLEERLKQDIILPRANISPAKDISLSAPVRARLEAKHPQMFEDWENARR